MATPSYDICSGIWFPSRLVWRNPYENRWRVGQSNEPKWIDIDGNTELTIQLQKSKT